MEEQQKTGEALFDKLSQEKKQRRRKRLRRVIIIVAVIFAALVMVVSHLRKNVDEALFHRGGSCLSEAGFWLRSGDRTTHAHGTGIR